MKLVSSAMLCALLVCVVSGHILERPAGLACWFTGCATQAEAAIGRKLLQSASPLDTTGGCPSPQAVLSGSGQICLPWVVVATQYSLRAGHGWCLP